MGTCFCIASYPGLLLQLFFRSCGKNAALFSTAAKKAARGGLDTRLVSVYHCSNLKLIKLYSLACIINTNRHTSVSYIVWLYNGDNRKNIRV